MRRLAPHSHKRSRIHQNSVTLLVNLNSNPASSANGKAHPHSTGVAFRDPPSPRHGNTLHGTRHGHRTPGAIARRVGSHAERVLTPYTLCMPGGVPLATCTLPVGMFYLLYLPARTCLLTSHSTGVTSQWNTTLHPHDSHVSIGHLPPLRARCFALAWCHQRTECPPRRATQHHPSVV